MFKLLGRLLRGKPAKSTNRRTVLRLEALEDRCVPSTADIWQPAGVNTLASNTKNWSAGVVPTIGYVAVYDGGAATNQPCIVDTPITCDGIQLQNGYNSPITLNPVTFSATNFVDASPSNDVFNVAFSGGSTLSIQNGVLTTLAFTGAGGTFQIGNGSTSTVYADGGYTQTTTVPWSVAFGATLQLNVNGTNCLTLNNGANLTVQMGGILQVQGNNGDFALESDDNGEILENYGSTVITGGTTLRFLVPALNHGAFYVQGGSTAYFKGSSPLTDNFDFKTDGGTVYLYGGSTLYCNWGYEQTGGTLQTDTTAETVRVGRGDMRVNGGNVKLGTATAYGQLNVTGNLTFGAGSEYDPKINLGVANQQDQIKTTGSVTTAAGSKMVVTGLGTLVAGLQWDVIKTLTVSTMNFGANATLPAGVTQKPGNNDYFLNS